MRHRKDFTNWPPRWRLPLKRRTLPVTAPSASKKVVLPSRAAKEILTICVNNSMRRKDIRNISQKLKGMREKFRQIARLVEQHNRTTEALHNVTSALEEDFDFDFDVDENDDVASTTSDSDDDAEQEKPKEPAAEPAAEPANDDDDLVRIVKPKNNDFWQFDDDELE